jgi:putative transposase
MEEKSSLNKEKVDNLWENTYYKHSSHATYNLTWHFVWITKYRRKVLNKEIQKRLETIIRWVCNDEYIVVLSLGFEEDHVHCLLSLPITSYIPDIVRHIKWRTSKVIRQEFKEHLKKYYKWRWSEHLWAVWYFFCSVWKVNEEIVRKYVENQGREDCRWVEVDIL